MPVFRFFGITARFFLASAISLAPAFTSAAWAQYYDPYAGIAPAGQDYYPDTNYGYGGQSGYTGGTQSGQVVQQRPTTIFDRTTPNTNKAGSNVIFPKSGTDTSGYNQNYGQSYGSGYGSGYGSNTGYDQSYTGSGQGSGQQGTVTFSNLLNGADKRGQYVIFPKDRAQATGAGMQSVPRGGSGNNNGSTNMSGSTFKNFLRNMRSNQSGQTMTNQAAYNQAAYNQAAGNQVASYQNQVQSQLYQVKDYSAYAQSAADRAGSGDPGSRQAAAAEARSYASSARSAASQARSLAAQANSPLAMQMADQAQSEANRAQSLADQATSRAGSSW